MLNKTKYLTAFISLSFVSCLGMQEGGDVAELFKGVESVQQLSPSSVRVKWSKPKNFSSFKVFLGTGDILNEMGSSRLSSYTLTGLNPNTNYNVAVSGINDSSGEEEGKSTVLGFTTLNIFSGISGAIPLSSSSVQISWNYEAEGVMFMVYMGEGTPPADFSKPYKTTTENILNITGLKSATTYYFIVRVMYVSSEVDTNNVVMSVTTDSSIKPMPVITTDRVVLGRYPAFNITGLSGGTKVYLMHQKVIRPDGTEIDKGDAAVLSSITGDGIYQVPKTYNSSMGFEPGEHYIKVRVTKSTEDMTVAQPLILRVRDMEHDWYVAPTNYKSPQMMGYADYTGTPLAAGDYNNDGYEDLAVGFSWGGREFTMDASYDEYNIHLTGFVVVYYGDPSLILKNTPAPSKTPLEIGDPAIVEPATNLIYAPSNFGAALSGRGDLNGDGYSDLVAGIMYSSLSAGVASVFYGSSQGLTSNNDFAINASNTCSGGVCQNLAITDPSPVSYEYFGTAAAHVGDLNGDGYGDIGVYDGWVESGNYYTGRVILIYGSSSGLVLDWANLKVCGAVGATSPCYIDRSYFGETPTGSDWFGSSIGGGRNIAGDAKDDLVIGGYAISDGTYNAVGRMYVLYNHGVTKGSGFGGYKVIQLPTDQRRHYDYFGSSFDVIPDANGDGYAEIVASLSQTDSPNVITPDPDRGAIVYFGKADGVWTPSDCNTQLGSPYTEYAFNTNACKAGPYCCPQILNLSGCATSIYTNPWPLPNIRGGDFNADGKGDFIIGDYNELSSKGVACMYYGGGATKGMESAIVRKFTNDARQNNNSLFGNAVAVGDFSGDGFDDVAVSMPYDDTVAMNSGSVSVYKSINGFPMTKTSADLVIDDYVTLQKSYERTLAQWAGDVNGDGYDDVLLTVAVNDNPTWHLFTYYNNDSQNGFVIVHGSASGLVMTPDAVQVPVGSNEPQIVAPYNIWGSVPGVAPDTCKYPYPFGDVNGDGNYDIGCFSFNNNLLVFFGVVSGGVDVSSAPIAYASRLDYDTRPQRFYDGCYAWTCAANLMSIAPNAVGDFNGDGYGDVAMPQYQNYGLVAPFLNEYGQVTVVYGSKNGLQDPSGTSAIHWQNGTPAESYCITDHVVIHDPCDGTSHVCKIQRLVGKNAVSDCSGSPLEPSTLISGAYFGWRTAAMDINNDGYDDVAVGAQYMSFGGGPTTGAAYIYYGSPTGLRFDNMLTVNPLEGFQKYSISGVSGANGHNAYFGTVANARDVNGDGYEDLFVGSFGGSPRGSQSGLGFMFFGGPAGLQYDPVGGPDQYILNNNNQCASGVCKVLIFYPSNLGAYQGFGISAVAGGDFNYSGTPGMEGQEGIPSYDDIIVGAPWYSIHGFYTDTASHSFSSGEGYLFTGSATGLVVEGDASNNPTCFNGSCTPYNFYPKSDDRRFRDFLYVNNGYIFGAVSFGINGDFNGDGYVDAILPIGPHSCKGGTYYTGGWFVLW